MISSYHLPRCLWYLCDRLDKKLFAGIKKKILIKPAVCIGIFLKICVIFKKISVSKLHCCNRKTIECHLDCLLQNYYKILKNCFIGSKNYMDSDVFYRFKYPITPWGITHHERVDVYIYTDEIIQLYAYGNGESYLQPSIDAFLVESMKTWKHP